MSKRSQERSSHGSPMVKAKHVVSFGDNAYLWGQDYSSNPQSPGSTRDSHVWPWEETSEKSGWYASGNREYSSEDSGSLAETHASQENTRKVVQNIKNQLRHDESFSEISINFEKMHISTWTRFKASSMQVALRMDPKYERNLELFKNSELENIQGVFGITRMMIEGNSEIKNVSRRRCGFILEKTCIA